MGFIGSSLKCKEGEITDSISLKMVHIWEIRQGSGGGDRDHSGNGIFERCFKEVAYNSGPINIRIGTKFPHICDRCISSI